MNEFFFFVLSAVLAYAVVHAGLYLSNCRLFFLPEGWCPIRGQQKNIGIRNLNHILRRSFCKIYFKQGESVMKGNCKKNTPLFQSSCPQFWGYKGFFYCNVTGRGIQLAARNKVADPLSLSRVSSSPFFPAEIDNLT